jgi:hypothetical protein
MLLHKLSNVVVEGNLFGVDHRGGDEVKPCLKRQVTMAEGKGFRKLTCPFGR